MITEQDKILEHFDHVFRDFESRLNGMSGQPLHDLQRKSLESLKQVRFPDRKHEDWKYTSIQKLLSTNYTVASSPANYSIPAIPGLDSHVIPIVNGKVLFEKISPEFLKTGIRFIPLHLSLEDASWKEVFAKWISTPEMSPNKAFEFLNLTFQSTGFFLDIPKNTILDKPVEIQIIHDDEAISFSNPLYFIRCGAGSKAAVFERIEKNADNPSGTTDSFINSIGYIHLDKNASLIHTKWQDLPITQNLVYKLFVTQFRDSRFETFAFDFGGNVVRNNVEVELEEHNTYTSLQAGYMASLRQSMDHQTRINHKVAYCESHELYKGIIDQYSSAAFNGKVFVHKDAQKTNAYQQNDTLVLSNHALMNSKPQLEIYADDVKCSHGATIGQMDEKALFYLKSRGIRPDVARHILKKAFIAQVLDKVPNESIRTYVTTQMSMES